MEFTSIATLRLRYLYLIFSCWLLYVVHLFGWSGRAMPKKDNLIKRLPVVGPILWQTNHPCSAQVTIQSRIPRHRHWTPYLPIFRSFYEIQHANNVQYQCHRQFQQPPRWNNYETILTRSPPTRLDPLWMAARLAKSITIINQIQALHHDDAL